MEKIKHTIAGIARNPDITTVWCSCGASCESKIDFDAVSAAINHCEYFNSGASESIDALQSIAQSAIADAVSMGINIGCGVDIDTITDSVVRSYKSMNALMSSIEDIGGNV